MKNLILSALNARFSVTAVALSAVLNSACNAPGDDHEGTGPSESAAPIEFTETHATQEGTYYGSHDERSRTITFNHNADSIECSHDGGLTYGPCESQSSAVWTVDDYNSGRELKVKFVKAGTAERIFSYTPKTAKPNLQFETCSAVVSSNEDFDTFSTRVDATKTNPVICLEEGIEISDLGGQWSIAVAAMNAKIVGTAMNPPKFISTGGVFSIHRGLSLSRVKLRGSVYFQVPAVAQTSSFDHVEIVEPALDGIYMQSAHTLTLRNSKVTAYGNAVNMNGGAAARPTLIVEDSLLQSENNMVMWLPMALAVTIRRSTVQMLADIAYPAIGIGTGAHSIPLVLEDSTIETAFDGLWIWSPVTIQVDGTVFRHVGQSNDGTVFRGQGGSGLVINSTENNNVFCSVGYDPTWMTWTQFSQIVWAYSGSFDLGLHELSQCQ
ncbi:MAG TPA: hypothetical protein VFV50_15960 [Bdellovibrionales bacterium]|nr:hypothetical protein [Bdellovibrionales bacterium]